MKTNWLKINSLELSTILEKAILRGGPYIFSHLLVYLRQGKYCKDCKDYYSFCKCNFCGSCEYNTCICNITLTLKDIRNYVKNWILYNLSKSEMRILGKTIEKFKYRYINYENEREVIDEIIKELKNL